MDGFAVTTETVAATGAAARLRPGPAPQPGRLRTHPTTSPTRAAVRTAAGKALVSLLLTLLTAVSACTADPTDPPMKTYADLAARPRLEDITARYDEMQQRIRDRVETELQPTLGPLGWRQVRDGSRSTCGYDVPPEFGGRKLYLPPWGFDHPIPDQQWAQVHRIVTDITAEYGFTSAGLAIDDHGHHLLNGVDTTLGATYEFGSQVLTTMQVSTGCHLPRDTPAP